MTLVDEFTGHTDPEANMVNNMVDILQAEHGLSGPGEETVRRLMGQYRKLVTENERRRMASHINSKGFLGWMSGEYTLERVVKS